MDDTTLTRIAIEEIIRDLHNKAKKDVDTKKKRNPPIKPNKEFLGRTITSVISHNKREDELQRRKCKAKLKELDDQRKRTDVRKHSSSKSERCSSKRSYSSSSSEKSTHRSKKHKYKKRKKKEHRKKHKSKKESERSKSRSKYKDNTEVQQNDDKYLDFEKYKELYWNQSIDCELNATFASDVYNELRRQYIYHQTVLSSINEDSVHHNLNVANEIDMNIEAPVCSSPSLTVSSLSSTYQEDNNEAPTINLLSEDESQQCDISSMCSCTETNISLGSAHVSTQDTDVNNCIIVDTDTDSTSSCCEVVQNTYNGLNNNANNKSSKEEGFMIDLTAELE